jgi:hypothetical protein
LELGRPTVSGRIVERAVIRLEKFGKSKQLSKMEERRTRFDRGLDPFSAMWGEKRLSSY